MALAPEQLAAVADHRRAEPPKLAALLRGDLDWVVMKALEKDRGRRYETANGLATELQRHLDNEPVVARPPSWSYRFMKLVRRNRVVFIAGGAVALALVMGMGTSTWLFLKEREARQRAVAAEQQQARLRHEAEEREKMTQAALLVSQEKFPEADGLLSEITLTQPTMEGSAVFRSVGEWHALQNRWRQAASRLSSLLRVDQLDGADTSTMDYLECGPALIEVGDLTGYERFREEAVARFGAAPGPFADRIVKISLLLPASKQTLDALAPLTEAMVKSQAAAEAAGDGFSAAWRAMAMGLLEYRRGNYVEALNWSDRCLEHRETNLPRTATARTILAMAYYRLGRAAAADKELAGSRAILDEHALATQTRGNPIQGFWFDWAFARILLREATTLIGPPRAL